MKLQKTVEKVAQIKTLLTIGGDTKSLQFCTLQESIIFNFNKSLHQANDPAGPTLFGQTRKEELEKFELIEKKLNRQLYTFNERVANLKLVTDADYLFELLKQFGLQLRSVEKRFT